MKFAKPHSTEFLTLLPYTVRREAAENLNQSIYPSFEVVRHMYRYIDVVQIYCAMDSKNLKRVFL